MNRSQPASDKLFPLPLTSMEIFHLFDNRPGDPNYVYARMRFGGLVVRALLEQASAILSARQPLFRAVCEKINGRWYWVQGDVSPVFHWYQRGEPAKTEDFDLRLEAGLRLHVWNLDNETELLIQVHHTLMDGAAAIVAINDLLQIYHNLVHGIAAETGLKANDAHLLCGRNRLDLFSKLYLRHLYKQPIALFGTWNFIYRRFVTLVPDNAVRPQGGANQSGTPKISGEWLPASAVAALTETAAAKRVTLNTLIMAKLFRTVYYWRSIRQPVDERAWFRVILPMNIRSVADRRLPATNRTTVMVVDRQKRHMDAWETFLKYLDREVRLIRDWHLHRMFLLFVRCMSYPRWRLLRSARSDKPRGTIILTNLGTPFRWSTKPGKASPTGNLILTDFDFVGPVRAHTPVNFSIQQHGDRIRLSMHFDTGQITESEAQALFADFRHQLVTDAKSLGQ